MNRVIVYGRFYIIRQRKTDDGTFATPLCGLSIKVGRRQAFVQRGRQLWPLQGADFRHSLPQAACGRFIIAQTLFSLLRSRHLPRARIRFNICACCSPRPQTYRTDDVMRSETLITIRPLSQSTISSSIEAGNGREQHDRSIKISTMSQRFSRSVSTVRRWPSSYSRVEMPRSIAPQRVPGQASKARSRLPLTRSRSGVCRRAWPWLGS